MTYIKIPKDKLKIGMKVHVSGWNRGCVFLYQGEEGGRHKLLTPKTRKTFYTTNSLQYVRANQPEPINFHKGMCRFHGSSNKYCCGNWTEVDP